jgi:hypothetical protein
MSDFLQARRTIERRLAELSAQTHDWRERGDGSAYCKRCHTVVGGRPDWTQHCETKADRVETKTLQRDMLIVRRALRKEGLDG